VAITAARGIRETQGKAVTTFLASARDVMRDTKEGTNRRTSKGIIQI
jgi:hypothetical protein